MRSVINGLHRVTVGGLRFLQKLVGSSTVGVKAIVLNDKQEVLLVKHTYCPGWYLPGGGVKAGENAETAVIRELYEETGVIVEGRPQLLGVFYHQIDGVDDYPILYLIKNYQLSAVSSPEIAEFNWFDHQTLPADVTPATQKRLLEFFNQQESPTNW